MIVRYLHWLGIAACIILMVSCFLPWMYYADINQQFTGFYSYKNAYGKPGYFLCLLSLVTLLFIFLPKVWAKRANLFIGAIMVAYGIKSYILFSSCYNNYCPQKLPALYVMLYCCIIIMIAAAFPHLTLSKKDKA